MGCGWLMGEPVRVTVPKGVAIVPNCPTVTAPVKALRVTFWAMAEVRSPIVIVPPLLFTVKFEPLAKWTAPVVKLIGVFSEEKVTFDPALILNKLAAVK